MKYLNLVNAVIEVLASYKNENKKFSIHDITSSIRSAVNAGECIIVDLVSLYGTKTVMHESVKTAFEYILPILSVDCELVDGKYRSFEFIDNVAAKNTANTANTVDNSKGSFAQTAKELSDVLANEIVKHLDSIGVGVDLSDASNVSDCGCSRKSQNKSSCQNSAKSNPIHDALNSLNSSTTFFDNTNNSNCGDGSNESSDSSSNPPVDWFFSKPTRPISYLAAINDYYKKDFDDYDNSPTIQNISDHTIKKIREYFIRNNYETSTLRNIAKSVGNKCSLVAYCICKYPNKFDFICALSDGKIKNADAILVCFNNSFLDNNKDNDKNDDKNDNKSNDGSKGKIVFNQPKVAMNPLSKLRRDICSAFSTAVQQYYESDFSKYALTHDEHFNNGDKSLNRVVEKIKAYFKRSNYFHAPLRNIAKSVVLPCSFVAYCVCKSGDDFGFSCVGLEDGRIKNADAISVYFFGE